MARLFIIIGAVFIVVGLVLLLAGKIPWLGRLPGDIVVQRKNFTFYFPIATSIVVSIILSLILWLINRK